MYNDELDMALESAYDDGYVQALIDMGVDPNDIAEEDVDMYDDYDEAMEGNPDNKIKRHIYDYKTAGLTPEDVVKMRNSKGALKGFEVNYTRAKNSIQTNANRNLYRRTKNPQDQLTREYMLSRERGRPTDSRDSNYSRGMRDSHESYKNALNELGYRKALGKRAIDNYGRNAEGLYHKSR